MNVLWLCPDAKHSGTRAPSRPRKDDIRRYCLECSVASGRLTERVSPRLKAQREKAAVRNAQRRAKTKQSGRSYYMVDGADAEVLMRKLARLPGFRGYWSRSKDWRMGRHDYPKLVIHRCRRLPSTKFAHANTEDNEIHLYVTQASTANRMRAILLHELTHFVETGNGEFGSGYRCHTKAFRRRMGIVERQAEKRFGPTGWRQSDSPRGHMERVPA